MKIHFTKHALMRMEERNIFWEEVYEVFENPILVLERGETIVIGRTNSRRFLTLVFKGRRMLTLYPASRKQRRLYHEKGGKP